MALMHKVSRLLGWLLLGALVFVTVCPIGYRPVSAAPVSTERFGAFLLLGFLLAVGYPRQRLKVLLMVVAAAGILEVLQAVQPTRHGRVPDFLVKAAGGALGTIVAWVARALPGFVVSSGQSSVSSRD